MSHVAFSPVAGGDSRSLMESEAKLMVCGPSEAAVLVNTRLRGGQLLAGALGGALNGVFLL